MATPRINEFVFNHTGSDTNEFIEIFGDPNADLSAFTLVVIEGDGSGAGTIDRIFPLGVTDANGFWTTPVASNGLENGTQTILLVEGFTGSQGDDLDTDNDGVIDGTPPWTAIIDSVAVSDGGAGDFAYTTTVLEPDFDSLGLTVGGASRIPDGTDTDTDADWVRNDFDGAGLPDFPGVSADPDEAVNTPGSANTVATPTIVINEIDSDTPGTDTAEFIELFDGGAGNTPLDGLVVVLFNGSNDQSYRTIDLAGHTTNADGYFVIGNSAVGPDLVIPQNTLQNGADAVALYSGTAADFPNGTAPTSTNLLDAVVYGTGDADDPELLAAFGPTVQFDEDALGDKDTDSIGRDPNGTGGFVTLDTPTPGSANDAVPPTMNIVINEIDSDTPGPDSEEFIELFDGGVGNTSLNGLVLVLFNGSNNQSYQTIDLAGQTTDANGYFVAGNSAVSPDLVFSGLQNGADAVALYSGTPADFPNGTGPTTANLIDAVVYGTGDPDAAGLLSGLGQATQIDENGLGDQATDSIGRDPNGTGDFIALDTPTPGAANDAVPPATNIVINEIDADTPGTDAAEFVELFDGGVGNTPLDGLVLVLFNGSNDQSYQAIELNGFSTNAEGYFLLGNSGLSPDLELSGLQNGADAVGLYIGSAADFPNGTGPTTTNLLDAIVYGTNDADDAGLLAGLGQTTQFNESSTTSIGRDPNGTGDFAEQIFPTPGFDNDTLPPTTAAAIHEIQGAGHRSPLEGEAVTTTGIVTAVDSDGFYMQDAIGDGDIATSDGIFVFTGAAPSVAVGDEAQVSAFVEERQFSPDLSLTRLASVFDIEVQSSGNALPDAIVLGDGGRQVPTEVIDDDGLTSFDPETDAIDFYESLEGMLVTVPDAVVVAPTNRFGEIWTVADGGANATGLNARGGITIDSNDFNPERIQIQADNTLTPGGAPATNAGDSLGDVTGVVSYSFGNFEVRATEAITPTDAGLTPEVTALDGTTDQLLIASYNVENLDPNDADGDTDIADGKFEAIAQQIVNNVNAPDIVALQEVQDNSGSANDGVIDASLTYQTLIDAIVAAGGPQYEFFDLPPENNTDGGQPGGNIRVGYLYNPERVSLDESSAVRIVDTDLSDGDSFQATRKPLAVEFTFNDQTVHIVNNHFSSKGGSTSLFGETQPPTNGNEDKRTEQAAIVNEYVDGILAADADAKVVVLGDINEFDFNPPLDALKGEDDALVNLTERFTVRERYTFNFQGNAQSLDHVLVAATLAGVALAELDIVHANTEFADQASDHDPSVLLLAVARSDLIFTDGNDSTFSRDFRGFDFSGDDFLNAFAGNDKVFAKGGDDTVLGGEGKDRLYGGKGDDKIYGQEGDDRVFGEDGNDRLFGNEGRDRIWGGDGNDEMDGGAGRDRLYGGDDDDTIRGGADDDRLYGQRGNDWLFGDEGDDRLYGDRGHDWLFGGAGNDRLDGGRDDDVLDGGAGDDRLKGGSGNDILIGGEGDDIVDGDTGGDIYVFGIGDGHDIFLDFDLPRGWDDDDDEDDDDDDDDNERGLSFDRIDLVEFGFDDFGDVTALFEDAGRDTVIHVGVEMSITLVGVNTDALLVQSEVFILV